MRRTRTGVPSNGIAAVFLRRSKERAIEHLDPLFAGLTVRMAKGMFGSDEMGWLRFAPALSRRTRSPSTSAWPDREPADVPPELQSYAGIQRDPAAEDRAFAERPLRNFNQTHIEGVMWLLQRSWTWLITPYPMMRRSLRKIDAVRAEPPATQARNGTSPAALATVIRREAKRIGISEVGFAMAEAKYTFDTAEDPSGSRIIVCLLEQAWEPTQTAPSSQAERTALRTYATLAERVAALTHYLHSLGYAAWPNDWGSLDGIAIRYAVEAGLGQLGLNGQLLTPIAGSRARIALITTDAPMELGTPVDFGIPRICDECQLCVRRCPPGAIPKVRLEKRGVVKASIKPERCFPVVAQAHGCAVCMKVCPVQRYGLDAVTDHFSKTGRILGKGTDELEGYVWPLDGRYYGPGEKPKITAELINPPGWHFDRSRTA